HVHGRRGAVPIDIELTIEAGAGKRAKVNGATLRAAEQLRSETAALVFTPDRLGVVKGAPAARRAYFDRVLGRLSPARAQLPVEYGAAVAQRNASLRRVAAGFSTRAALQPWTEQVAELGAALVDARREALALLGSPFAERAGVPRLLLLDDVLSELDPGRRRILAGRLARSGQAFVTATDAAMLPAEPDQLLEVATGEVYDRTAG